MRGGLGAATAGVVKIHNPRLQIIKLHIIYCRCFIEKPRYLASDFVVLIIIGMQLTVFLLGMVLDPGGIQMITIPIYAPIVVALGFDPVWFGILFIMNIETGYLTPPFGWNIFYLKSIVPEGITIIDIYRSIIAFVALQILGLALVMIFPQITLLLPNLIIGR